jgi:hypothetical protein
MKTKLSLLFKTSALTVALGLPALAAMQSGGNATDICGSDVCAMMVGDGDQPMRLFRVSGDDSDEDHDGGRSRRGHDDDDHNDGCDDYDGEVCGAASGKGNPAAAGTVAPPANGLFGNGAPPVAVTN